MLLIKLCIYYIQSKSIQSHLYFIKHKEVLNTQLVIWHLSLSGVTPNPSTLTSKNIASIIFFNEYFNISSTRPPAHKNQVSCAYRVSHPARDCKLMVHSKLFMLQLTRKHTNLQVLIFFQFSKIALYIYLTPSKQHYPFPSLCLS